MANSRWILARTLVATLLLGMSLTMLADFTHRLLTSDPDTIGIFSIAIQAVLAVVASSTFATEGWSLLPQKLVDMQQSDAGKATLRFRLSASLFLVIAIIWFFAPARLAQYYNARGYARSFTAPAAIAARDYHRAIALDPSQQFAYYNLGGALETYYRYDDAAEQYEKAIAANPFDPTPYSNLAHVLLLDGKADTALQIASDALALPSLSTAGLDRIRLQIADPAANAKDRKAAEQQLKLYLADIDALYRSRAEAELDLGFYAAAIAHAGQSKSASAQCLLGQAYAKLGQTANAQIAWTNLIQMLQTAPDAVRPSCALLAEENHENH